jgi:hypothetical protein
VLSGASSCVTSAPGTSMSTATASPAATQSLAKGAQPPGTIITTAAGDKYTVLAFESVLPKNGLNTPPPAARSALLTSRSARGAVRRSPLTRRNGSSTSPARTKAKGMMPVWSPLPAVRCPPQRP